ncbi:MULTISPECIES: toxin-antitoxin system protein [unclassified Shigella]|uniref:toxin-antitoxin system protein n=1 Tax=unclassified Shigella TaxID=2629414 RepID=UPI000847E316|nr:MULTISPECIES: toxin-antitoxin system protein [unclassified Shigella]ODQ08302.1 toxin-antitoxin system protein [Shigella sp. FC130]OEI90043.1 toxin-antitoxin system protein [Shigella sp. FC1655]OEJ04494.1 toxin-antitoxin system protein [Shigella sp. FC1967]
MQKTTKKKTNRYFNDVPTTRLIVTCEQSVIDRVDIHIKADRVTRGNRAEFVRQAIIEKLKNENSTNS